MMMANLAQICGEIAKPWKFVLCEPTLAVREETLASLEQHLAKQRASSPCLLKAAALTRRKSK